jgi:hypothetical protein
MSHDTGEPGELDLVPACVHLRHKMMYCDARQETPGLVDASSDTAVHFCIHTHDALGPDNKPVGPRLCGPGRSCFTDAGR